MVAMHECTLEIRCFTLRAQNWAQKIITEWNTVPTVFSVFGVSEEELEVLSQLKYAGTLVLIVTTFQIHI